MRNTVRTMRTGAMKVMLEQLETKLLMSAAVGNTTLLHDDFNVGSTMSSDLWHIPTWDPSGRTYLGQTQEICEPYPLPQVTQGTTQITIQSWNPTGYSFFGYVAISNQSFTLKDPLDIKVRAKMDAIVPGTVGAIYLYPTVGSVNPNVNNLEFDWEFLGTRPTTPQTNMYVNEPLGAGHPQYESYNAGSITDYHVYEIKWEPTSKNMSWLIDGNTVRSETISNPPTTTMNLNISQWIPGKEWADAYSPTLVPVSSPTQNKIYSMSVDYVDIQKTVQPSISITSVPITGVGGIVSGTVVGVDPANYKVAAYIRVDGGWWTKPLASSPTVSIDSNGKWSVNITTGGHDQNADEVVVALIPSDVNPTICLGSKTLPDLSAYIHTGVSRNLSAQQYVTGLYQNVLHRQPDQGGLDAWTSQLAKRQITTSNVAKAFLTSTEYYFNEVGSLYHSVLKRNPDVDGLNNWIAYLQSGHSYQEVESLFLGSVEYRGNKSAPALINSYYQTIFGRDADSSGLTYWSGLITNGTPSSVVALKLENSVEGSKMIVSNAYSNYLHRDADVGGLNNWIGYLQSGARQEDLFLNLIVSWESLKINVLV